MGWEEVSGCGDTTNPVGAASSRDKDRSKPPGAK
jgi:hypothetical protein